MTLPYPKELFWTCRQGWFELLHCSLINTQMHSQAKEEQNGDGVTDHLESWDPIPCSVKSPSPTCTCKRQGTIKDRKMQSQKYSNSDQWDSCQCSTLPFANKRWQEWQAGNTHYFFHIFFYLVSGTTKTWWEIWVFRLIFHHVFIIHDCKYACTVVCMYMHSCTIHIIRKDHTHLAWDNGMQMIAHLLGIPGPFLSVRHHGIRADSNVSVGCNNTRKAFHSINIQ